jgi:hypothetical protein
MVRHSVWRSQPAGNTTRIRRADYPPLLMDVNLQHSRSRRTQWALILLLLFCAMLLPGAAAPGPREHDVKSALLFNFTRFVEWPDSAFATESTPVVIGILGRDPFGTILDDIVRDEKCGSRSIKVERYRNVESARDCQIVFISESEQADLPRIFRVLKGRPILTVGDVDGFLQKGGMIRFIKDPAGKIHLNINLNAIKAADLTVSAKLLRIAEVVTPSD